MSPESKRHLVYRIQTEYIFQYLENADSAFEIADRLLTYIHRRGSNVVLLECPRSPLAYTAYEAVESHYESNLRELAARRHVPLWRFPRELQIEDAEFYDLDHLVASGRKKYSTWLVDQLKRMEPNRG